MNGKVLAIRTADLKTHPAFHGFLGLPQEEIQRYHATLEVHALERGQVENNPDYKQLICATVLHFNYSWLTYRQTTRDVRANRSMALYGHIVSDDQAPLFLDDSHKVSVHHILRTELQILGKYNLRLAGLLNDDADDFGRLHFGLVYVAKLLQPGVNEREKGISGIAFAGSGELGMDRDQFEPWSRILIENMAAL